MRKISPLLLLLPLLLAACAGRGPGALPGVAGVAATTAAPATAPASATPPAPTTTPAPSPTATATATLTPPPSPTFSPTPTPEHPLMIEVMRRQSYPGSELTIERTLEPGENYDRFIASYLSEGNRIYALLTVPWGAPPPTGWPVIIFNHGWIPPEEYVTELRYVEYVDYIARSGYIVFRSDYRGHGQSEGEAGMPYSSPGYTIDVLNGMAAVLTRADADANRVGMWGHSMGGYITLRAMVVSDRIRAGVIWGGVVGPYPDLFQRGAALTPPAPTALASTLPASTPPASTPPVATATPTATPTPTPAFRRGRWRGDMAAIYGSPEENPAFWASISAPSFVAEISGPVQLHHAITDDTVPWAASQSLYDAMTAAGVPVELYLYDNDSHDIDNNFYTAMRRTVEFFDRYVKEGAGG